MSSRDNEGSQESTINRFNNSTDQRFNNITMKNKLHKNNISCHPEQSEGSHSIFYILYSILLILFSIPATAQTYNWQWAMKGGGDIGGIDEEQIHDVKVGSDNNYYFIATIKGNSGTQLNGIPQTVYNVPNGGDDIFLFSTTCDGTVRWSQAIGGEGLLDRAYGIALDSNNNVYVGAHVQGGSNYSVHFSPNPTDDVTPFPANPDAYKRTYLVKYDSNGNFINKKALQGTVDNTNNQSQILDLYIDSTDTIHFIVGFRSGSHLGNQVTVPATINAYQYFLAKYDNSLNYVSSILLPITDGSGFNDGQVKFAYDVTLNRYYIAGERSIGTPLTYNGDTIVNKSFILAFNSTNGNEIWRREVYADPTSAGGLADNRFNSLIIDDNSDVYFGGRVYQSANAQNPIKIYDPTDTNVQPYLFTPTTNYALPMIMKLNSDGDVQWVQATSARSQGAPPPGPRQGKGIALNGSEVAFGAQGANEFWDAIEIVRPLTGFQPDPILIRFNKQTGNVIAVHEIYGDSGSSQSMTAVATDNDGNYITGGSFQANLFMNNTLGVTPLVSTGQADFFVAKLGATPCGTPVSTDKFNKLHINIYPNPTNDIVNIETPETLHNYEVYNVLGKQIQKGMFNSNNQVNLHGAVVGTYFIKVTTTQGSTATVKVVKK